MCSTVRVNNWLRKTTIFQFQIIKREKLRAGSCMGSSHDHLPWKKNDKGRFVMLIVHGKTKQFPRFLAIFWIPSRGRISSNALRKRLIFVDFLIGKTWMGSIISCYEKPDRKCVATLQLPNMLQRIIETLRRRFGRTDHITSNDWQIQTNCLI